MRTYSPAVHAVEELAGALCNTAQESIRVMCGDAPGRPLGLRYAVKGKEEPSLYGFVISCSEE